MSLKLDSVKPAFEDDLVDLITSEGGRVENGHPIAVTVFTLLKSIANGELSGLELEERAGTADLSDCRKIYFDLDPREARPRFRLVYRLLPNEERPTHVQAVAVGYRASLDAYVRAARNLGRI